VRSGHVFRHRIAVHNHYCMHCNYICIQDSCGGLRERQEMSASLHKSRFLFLFWRVSTGLTTDIRCKCMSHARAMSFTLTTSIVRLILSMFVVPGTPDFNIKQWDLRREGQGPVRIFDTNRGYGVCSLAIEPRRQYLYGAMVGGWIHCWDLHGGASQCKIRSQFDCRHMVLTASLKSLFINYS
jgi:hypothetical protein